MKVYFILLFLGLVVHLLFFSTFSDRFMTVIIFACVRPGLAFLVVCS